MSSLERQVGGDHYKKYKIEPIVYVSKNKIIHTLANIIKYASRANLRPNTDLEKLRLKIQDLQKIIHYAEIEIDFAIEEFEDEHGTYPDKEIKQNKKHVLDFIEPTLNLEGLVIEIGCWKGETSVEIANKIYPQKLQAVDWWKGNTETPESPSVLIASTEDIKQTFIENINRKTQGNVDIFSMDLEKFIDSLSLESSRIKFCFLDAALDYRSMSIQVVNLAPMIVPGGILCGTSFNQESVRLAITEILPAKDINVVDDFWWWSKPLDAPMMERVPMSSVADTWEEEPDSD